jgi:alkaline phosphatase D
MLRERPNPIIVSGDIHAAGVAGLHETLGDVSSARIGTELVGTSVTSRFDAATLDVAEAIIKALPYVEYANGRERGYTIVDLTRQRMTATFKVVSTIDSPDATVAVAYVAEVDARSELAPPPAAPVPASVTFTG